MSKLFKLFDRIWRGVIHFPKTLYINFKALPLKQAVHLPIIVMSACKLKGIRKNSIVIDGDLSKGMIKLGPLKSGGSGVALKGKTSIILKKEGSLLFHGSASIGSGTAICVTKGKIEFGDRFSCNVNCFFSSNTLISFGKDNLLGWNVNIRDDDGHPIYNEAREITNHANPVIINERVWIASCADILKGVTIAEGSIIGYRSLVTKSIEEKNTISAGVPAKIVKRGAYWEHN